MGASPPKPVVDTVARSVNERGMRDSRDVMRISLKSKVHAALECTESTGAWHHAVTVFITTLILLNVLAVILGTIEPVARHIPVLLHWFEVLSIGAFSVEYLLRIWSCTAEEKYSHPIAGRLKYAASPLALIDLLAVLPFYAPFLIRVDLRFLRVLRLLRLSRLLKLGRYSESLRTVTRVIRSRKEQLAAAIFVIAIMLILASSGIYYLEHDVQPAAFSSIPAAMWWGIVTLSNVGYGDIRPITTAGKVVGALIAFLGIGLFALPAGILASGFAEELKNKGRIKATCPHCGNTLHVTSDGGVHASDGKDAGHAQLGGG